MNNQKNREGFVPALIAFYRGKLKWSPKAVNGECFVKGMSRTEYRELFDRLNALSWAAADFLNTLDILGQGKPAADVFLELEKKDELYFAQKRLKNCAAFCGIDMAAEHSLVEFAERFVEFSQTENTFVFDNFSAQLSLF